MVDFKKIIFIFIYILVYMCVGAHGASKRAPGLLELQSQARNQTQLPWKS